MGDQQPKTPPSSRDKTPNEERFLAGTETSGHGWRAEAQAVIEDIKSFTKLVYISNKLPCDENGVYLNLETKESKQFTIELSAAGFRIRGTSFDNLDGVEDAALGACYETPYAILDLVSPGYRASFSGALVDKLNALLPENTTSN